MFEWLKNMLFDEDTTEIIDEELEEIKFTGEEDFNEILREERPVKEERKVVKEEIKEEVVVEKPEVETRSSFNIELTDHDVKPEKVVEVKPREERRVEHVERVVKDVEVSSVISPMFGGKEEKPVESLTPKVVASKKKDGLGTVISPMYGQEELEQHEQIARHAIKDVKFEEVLLHVDEEDWLNEVPMEELISKEEENDDCVQFSLFEESNNK